MHRDLRSLGEIDRCFRGLLRAVGRKHLLRFLPLAVLGLVWSGSCHLNRIAVALSWFGQTKSLVQRLRRWMMRDSSAIEELLSKLACCFVSSHGTDPVVLLIDRTEWKHANLLIGAAPFRGRAIPVAVMMLSGPKSTRADELAELLDRAAHALGADANVVVIGDREFGNIPAIKAIRSRGWHFCLRFKEDTWLYDGHGVSWQARDAFGQRGQRLLWRSALVTLQQYGPLNGAILWHKREERPWFLISDLPAETLYRLYKKRMQIEELFSDLKKRGFDLQASRMRDPKRLLALTLLLCITYIWLLIVATKAVRRGWRHLVDPAAKRGLSYFQIGRRMLLDQPEHSKLTINNPARIDLCTK